MGNITRQAIVCIVVFAVLRWFARSWTLTFVVGLVLISQQISWSSMFGGDRDKFPLEDWAEQGEEEAFEPELQILDSHHHLWDPRIHPKGWAIHHMLLNFFYFLKPRMTEEFLRDYSEHGVPSGANYGPRLSVVVPYMGPELLADIHGVYGKGHQVVGTVYVQSKWVDPDAEPECMAPVSEVDMVEEVHKEYPELCWGMVAGADLRLGAEVEPALEAYSKKPLVKAVRCNLAHSADTAVENAADADVASDAKFREGFALLSKYDLIYETWIYHEQIKGVASLAKAFPKTTIVVAHVGGPIGVGGFEREKTLEEWRKLVKELAKQQNVMMKLGGLGMAYCGFGFDHEKKPPTSDQLAAGWAPYINHCIDVFGVDRCMMESNFPSDKLTCTYTVLFNALKKIVRDRPMADKKKLFELNARRIYKLASAPEIPTSKCGSD